MFENQFHISLLIARKLRGELTVEEQKELEIWLNENKNNSDWATRITAEESLPVLITNYYSADENVVWDKLINKIKETKNVEPSIPVIKLYRSYRIAAAAAVLFVLSIGLYFYYTVGVRRYANRFTAHDIASGKNSATLTLANGRKIRLSDAVDGELAKEAGIRITKTKDGQIVYEMAPQTQNGNALAYNMLATSKGETYQVILPDKSIVWLNAASSLKYPASFTSLKERLVVLDGEAYFEIAHNSKQPFKVRTNSQVIEDIGTAFNVNSYQDEPDTKTTLVEGSVKIASQARNDERQAASSLRGGPTPSLRGGTPKQSTPDVILKPGEQAVNSGSQLRVIHADIEEAVAWKNGDFSFKKGDDFKSAMRKIARWYDVEVVYDASVPANIDLGGWISRKNNISKVLELIESAANVNLNLEGRRITVTK